MRLFNKDIGNIFIIDFLPDMKLSQQFVDLFTGKIPVHHKIVHSRVELFDILKEIAIYDTHDGVTGYIRRANFNISFNPDVREIAEIGIPLNSHLFLLIYSTRIAPPMQDKIQHANRETVEFFNKALYVFSKKWIACKNNIFLKDYVNSIK